MSHLIFEGITSSQPFVCMEVETEYFLQITKEKDLDGAAQWQSG